MTDQENKDVIDVDVSSLNEKPQTNQPKKVLSFWNKIEILISQCQFLITVILYVTLSLTLKITYGPYHLNGWAFWWILFLIVPLIPQLLKCFRKKNLQYFPMFFVVLVSYLLIGLLTGKWHPFWALFFIIPLYHSLMFKINAIFFSEK